MFFFLHINTVGFLHSNLCNFLLRLFFPTPSLWKYSCFAYFMNRLSQKSMILRSDSTWMASILHVLHVLLCENTLGLKQSQMLMLLGKLVFLCFYSWIWYDFCLVFTIFQPHLLPHVGDIPRSNFQFDFGLERKVLAEAEKDNPNWSKFGVDNLPTKASDASSSKVIVILFRASSNLL